MPVYEYKFNGCEKPVSIYFKTFSSAETSEPVCPECAIFAEDDVPDDQKEFIKANYDYDYDDSEPGHNV